MSDTPDSPGLLPAVDQPHAQLPANHDVPSDFEHQIATIAIDDLFQANVKKLVDEGWIIVPKIPPVAVYHLIRPKVKPALAAGGVAHLTVDDTKVFILRADGSRG